MCLFYVNVFDFVCLFGLQRFSQQYNGSIVNDETLKRIGEKRPKPAKRLLTIFVGEKTVKTVTVGTSAEKRLRILLQKAQMSLRVHIVRRPAAQSKVLQAAYVRAAQLAGRQEQKIYLMVQ